MFYDLIWRKITFKARNINQKDIIAMLFF